jgi:hypothetical protein
METNEIKDTCLYIHTRKSDGRIFYVGIGDKNRPTKKTGRNKYWSNTINSHGYNVTILKTGMSWEEACDLEIKMIAFYGRVKPNPKNPNYGCLVNMTDGGEGGKGVIISEEHKRKIREANIGKKLTDEQIQKLREINTGLKRTEEQKQKLRKPRSEEAKQNMRKNQPDRSGEKNAMFGKTGEKCPSFGKKATEETKQKLRKGKMSEKNPASKKVICSITNKIYGCIKDAVKDSGVSYVTLKKYLSGITPNKTSLRLL